MGLASYEMCRPTRESSVDDFLAEMVDMLNCQDGGGETLGDSECLEIVGHPTIPHVQSLRAPPAHVSLQTNSEPRLIGLTNRKAAKRYLQKLQKERIRNQEVLSDCLDNLPLHIRQVISEKSLHSEPVSARLVVPEIATHRSGRNSTEFWQDNLNKLEQEERFHMKVKMNTTDSKIRKERGRGGRNIHSSRRHPVSLSQCPDPPLAESNLIYNEHVHYPGFSGSQESQATNLKYKFGKKKPADEPQQPTTFKPRGFGSLYDELEFERRYKKVFDLNKHIHFVHTNFISGQRILKRNKLPPINSGVPSRQDTMEAGDIFAIMSVHDYNHPDVDPPCSPVTSPRRRESTQSSMTSTRFSNTRRSFDLSQEMNVPVGARTGTAGSTAGTIQSTQEIHINLPVGSSPSTTGATKSATSSPRNRLKVASAKTNGRPKEEFRRELTCSIDLRSEDNSKVVEDTGLMVTAMSINSAKTGDKDSSKSGSSGSKSKVISRSSWKEADVSVEPTPTPELEPFNISVRVEIKPKDRQRNGGHVGAERALVKPHELPPKLERTATDLDAKSKDKIPTILEGSESPLV